MRGGRTWTGDALVATFAAQQTVALRGRACCSVCTPPPHRVGVPQLLSRRPAPRQVSEQLDTLFEAYNDLDAGHGDEPTNADDASDSDE